jgi:hypothetical protein
MVRVARTALLAVIKRTLQSVLQYFSIGSFCWEQGCCRCPDKPMLLCSHKLGHAMLCTAAITILSLAHISKGAA